VTSLEDALEEALLDRRDALYARMRADGLSSAEAAFGIAAQRRRDDTWRREALATIAGWLTTTDQAARRARAESLPAH